MTSTCGTATLRNGPAQPDWIELLTVAARLSGRLEALADDLVEDYVEHCRLHGSSWSEIGGVLGMSRQAVQQRFLAPHREYDPAEHSDELRQAMVAMKEIAVRQRNNYIGTEHLLWGVMAEENSATRLLTALGGSRDEVRDREARRLTLGASRPAERIAWTPYSRKAMAIARELAAHDDPVSIGCDHLLAGMARVGRGLAAAVLAESGVDLEALNSAFAPADVS